MEIQQQLPSVSVIIPVYNKEDYITEFIAALKRQTLGNMEFIFIDDKGNDCSFDYIRKAAKDDSRFVCLVNEKNMGAGNSRNRGIAAARGEFIAFADADDLMCPNFYELLYNKAKETGAYIVTGQAVKLYSDGRTEDSEQFDAIKSALPSAKTLLGIYFDHWTSIYSRDWIMQEGAINAPDSSNGEDSCFQVLAVRRLRPSQYAMEKRAAYYYRQVEGSLNNAKRGAYYLEQYGRSRKYIIQRLLEQLETEEEVDMLAYTFEQGIGEAVNDCELGVENEEELIQYVDGYVDLLKQWKATGDKYRPGMRALIFDSLDFDAKIYIKKRQMLEMRRLLWFVANRDKIRKKRRKYKILTLFSFGKKRTRYKEEKAKLSAILRRYKGLLAQESAVWQRLGFFS